jgi:hypothetical protein
VQYNLINLFRLFPVIRRFRKSGGTSVPYMSDYQDCTVTPLTCYTFLQRPTHFSKTCSRSFPCILLRAAVEVCFTLVLVPNFYALEMSKNNTVRGQDCRMGVLQVFHRCLLAPSSSHVKYAVVHCLEADTTVSSKIPVSFRNSDP